MKVIIWPFIGHICSSQSRIILSQYKANEQVYSELLIIFSSTRIFNIFLKEIKAGTPEQTVGSLLKQSNELQINQFDGINWVYEVDIRPPT